MESRKASCADEGVDPQDTTIDSTDTEGNSTYLTTKTKFVDDTQSAPGSIISAQKVTFNFPQNTIPCLNKKKYSTDANTTIENCDTLPGVDDYRPKDSQDNNETIKYEYCDEKQSQISQTISHSNIPLWHKGCNQGTQQKHAETHAVMNSIFNTRKQNVQYRSIISDTFDGKILSSVQCLTCDTVSTTKETFQDLSLPIPNKDHLHMIHASKGNHQKSGVTCTDVYSHQSWLSRMFGWVLSWFWGPSVSLQDCLAAFFSADELKGDNMYSCEKCKKLRNGIKYSKVIELPEVLCIHLKRFRHEVMFSSKISSHVTFPMEGLDMSAFLHKSYPCEVTTYDLASVICHHGTAGSGHYTSYSLNYLNDQWYEFDDQYVTAVDPEVVKHCEAYVLFYRKCGDEMIKKRQCAVELMERSQNEHCLLKFHISKQWINKFNNFAEPGPIMNTDFLCMHGGVPPQKVAFADELCTVLPQAVWEYLHDTFGGGPPCTHLYICPICYVEQDNLNLKRKIELQDFTSMNEDFQTLETPAVINAVSMSWFKKWENFVCKEGELPGPIDNSPICYIKNDQALLKLGSDYCSFSKEMYQYLHGIYGGGPDVLLQSNTKVTSLRCPPFPIVINSGGHKKSIFTIPHRVPNVQPANSKVNLSSPSTWLSSNANYNDLESSRNTDSNDPSDATEVISSLLKHTKI